MKRAIVTGGAGFIGFHLAKHLADKGLEVTLIDNFTRNRADQDFAELIARDNVFFLEADMTRPDYTSALQGRYDCIYHLAAINGTKYFYEKPYEVLRVNILALMHLLEWVKPENCGKFVFSSSSEAYAGTIAEFGGDGDFIPSKEEIPLCINDVFNERFSYGGSKLAGELLTINYFKKVEVPFAIIRFHNIYGPRMGFEHVIPQFIMRIRNGETPFNIYGGQETRAFCYIDDAVRATELVGDPASCRNEVVHIGNDLEEIRIIDLAKMLLDLAGYEAPIKINPAPKGSVKRRCPDISKLRSLTGYEPQVGLEDGLGKSLEWYLQTTLQAL